MNEQDQKIAYVQHEHEHNFPNNNSPINEQEQKIAYVEHEHHVPTSSPPQQNIAPAPFLTPQQTGMTTPGGAAPPSGSPMSPHQSMYGGPPGFQPQMQPQPGYPQYNGQYQQPYPMQGQYAQSQYPQSQYGAYPQQMGPPPSTMGGTVPEKKRLCGMSKKVFFVVFGVVALVILIALGVGLGVGLGLKEDDGGNRSSSSGAQDDGDDDTPRPTGDRTISIPSFTIGPTPTLSDFPSATFTSSTRTTGTTATEITNTLVPTGTDFPEISGDISCDSGSDDNKWFVCDDGSRFWVGCDYALQVNSARFIESLTFDTMNECIEECDGHSSCTLVEFWRELSSLNCDMYDQEDLNGIYNTGLDIDLGIWELRLD